jgi:hypothetical protein
VFRRGKESYRRQMRLPEARIALVERYMIDADEAEARTRRGDEPVAEGDPEKRTEDLPVFAWLQGVESAAPTASDWTRELVRAKEARASEPGRT